MINVTKSYLPPLGEFNKYLERIWESNWLTNQGPLSKTLEDELMHYLELSNIQVTCNGTMALQLAIRALELKGEVITTPYSYVATTNSILWENCIPRFADIDSTTYCIDPTEIENAITDSTSAILATHVYGIPCDIEAIETIAEKYHLKVIYDGAHAFGVKVSGKSIFNFGDISSLSFHATKLFHTVEGGALVTNSEELSRKIELLKTFGHRYDVYSTLGINGKMSEVHAAMGLSILPHINEIISSRKQVTLKYQDCLNKQNIRLLTIPENVEYNYAYFPIFFESEKTALKVKSELNEANIFPRRYFFPSLNTLPFVAGQECPISETSAKSVLSLPLYHDLSGSAIEMICSIINKFA